MVRIKYIKTNKEHILVSKYIIESQTTKGKYKVKLNLQDVTYKIININSGRVYRGGERITHLTALKRAIKARLKKLGVVFELEIRKINKDKKKCLK